MPTEDQLEVWFPYIFAFNVLWVVGFLAFGALRRIQAGDALFPRKPDRAAFHQSMASGRNLRGFLSRLGGANNCLVVTVVDGRLKTDLIFPFNLAPPFNFYGIRIDVRLSEIRSIERRHRLLTGDVVTAKWGDDEGYEFKVGNPAALIQALDPSGHITARSPTPS